MSDVPERLRAYTNRDCGCDLCATQNEAADEIERLRKALQSVDALWTYDASLGFEDEMGWESPVGKVWAEVRAALTSPDRGNADGGERG